MPLRRYLTAAVAAACSLTLAGCGSAGVKLAEVSGKCLKGGQPFAPNAVPGKPTPPGDPGMRIFFIAADGASRGERHSANYDPATGVFRVPGTTGKGVPAGKYQVAVYVGSMGPPGSAKSPPPGGAKAADDDLGMYGKEAFKAEVDVPESGLKDYVIDLDTPPKK